MIDRRGIGLVQWLGTTCTVMNFRWVSLLILSAAPCVSEPRPIYILCSTFPIYQITRHVTLGRDGSRVDLLLPASLGCPHHYALTPADMQKLAKADVLVVNGLGLEEFLGAPLKQANSRLVVLDSSEGIQDLLSYDPKGPHKAPARDAEENPGDATGIHGPEDDDHDADRPGHSLSRRAANPHLFASPRMAARLAMNIGAGLSRVDPEWAPLYTTNACSYAARLNALADEMLAVGRVLKNRRIVQPHGVFDYLARDMGLEIVGTLQPHGREPSAAEMLNLVRIIRSRQAGAVFTEPQYSPRVGQAIAREAGIPAAVLDPAASGPEEAPLDYYERVMRRNLETLRAVLGVRD